MFTPLAMMFLANPCFAAKTVLSVQVWEKGGVDQLPCRAWVVAGGQQVFRPTTPACAWYERDRSFSCDGQFDIEVPPGPAVVHVERGKEYIPVDKQVNVEEGRTTTLKIALKRWIDMRQSGWYSADMHVHYFNEPRRLKISGRLPGDIRVVKQMALADDVNFVPLLSYWNDNVENWPEWPDGPVVRADGTHLVTLQNSEIERIEQADGKPWQSLGAPLMYGLSKPVYVAGVEKLEHTYPCDAALCRIARKSSPGCLIDLDKALWAENVVGVALGLYDSMQLCHNHYHRDKTFRMGWGMIGPELEEQKGDWGKSEMLYRTNLLYYHWLNCGFHLTATGGSAIGVMPVATGQSRTYAKLDGPLFSQESYFDAIRAGRTFATTGPMLFFTVNGKDVGTTIDFKTGQAPLAVSAEVKSIEPLESLEVIGNGLSISRTSAIKPGKSGIAGHVLETTWAPSRSGWVIARAEFARPDGSMHQAHTSPVYVRVDGKPTAFRKDAEYMIRWIDRIMEISEQPKRYPSEQSRTETQSIYREARAVYEMIAKTATDVWGD